MPLTKKQLIDQLMNSKLPDDTIVVKSSGIGFEDVYDVKEQVIVDWASSPDSEFTAIVLD